MEFNEIRTAIATNGKKYTFKVDKNYYTPEKGNKAVVFDGFEKFKYAVVYAEIKEDKGWHIEKRWGTDQIVDYDNGLVGYQQMGFYKSKEEAEKEYDLRKRVTGKLCDDGTAFADVFLVENN